MYKKNNIYDYLEQPIILPKDSTEEEIYKYLESFSLEGTSENGIKELHNYLSQDFKRFIYTLSLLINPHLKLKVFEIGSNPYYMTLLMHKYTNYSVDCSNYFGEQNTIKSQTLVDRNGEKLDIPFKNINIETADVSEYKDKYDMVLCCEVIEHMVESPMKAIKNIKSMLKKDGYLILSTPNVNRLENVARMIQGSNIYDPFSGYGIYGRHNREYNKHELAQILQHMGFEIEVMFSSNVHEEYAFNYVNRDVLEQAISCIPNRKYDLGQYIFLRAKNVAPIKEDKKLEWLYRSYDNTTI